LQQILLRCPVQATRQVSWKHCLFVWGLIWPKAKKKICGFPVSRPYLAFGRQNPDPKLFYWIMLVSVST
jgi:hypothetical protein